MKAFAFILIPLLIACNDPAVKHTSTSPNDTSPSTFQDTSSTKSSIGNRSLSNSIQTLSLTRDTHNIFPSRMHATGKVIAYHPSVPCGILCGAAFFKIELDKEPGGYPKKHLFIAAGCFDTPAKDILNKTLSVEVTKLALDDSSCFFASGAPADLRPAGITPWYVLAEYKVMK